MRSTFCLGEEDRAAQRSGANEDLGGFLRHQHRGENGLPARTQGDGAVVLYQDDPRLVPELLDECFGFLADGLRQLQAGIGVRHQHGGDTAADDFVGKHAVGGKIPGARRAEDLVDRRGVGVADEFDPGQGEQPGMEHGLDGRLLGLRVHAGGQQGVVDLLVRQALLLQQRQQRGEAALDGVLLLQGAEAGAAGFDGEGVVAEPHGGVAFAEDGQAAVFAADFVGEGQ